MSFEHSSTIRRSMYRPGALLAAVGLYAASPSAIHAGDPSPVETPVTITAGTVFDLSPVFDSQGAPVFPWKHEVRGLVQGSSLGNAVVGFQVSIHGGNACAGNHAFCLSGTMTITTLSGDQLRSDVIGWADADPKDTKPTPSMYLLHYDATISGGTGKLAGASGQGVVTGAFMFLDTDATDDPNHSDNVFCTGYAGVATWRFDGVLKTPAGPAILIDATPDKKVTISWPASAQDWRLQTNAGLDRSTWGDVTLGAREANGRKQVTVQAPDGKQFYRLTRE